MSQQLVSTKITLSASIWPVNRNTVLTLMYVLCLGLCESNYEQRWHWRRNLSITRQMGVKLKDGLEDAEWNTISKEKQSWGKKASMKSFHINVSVNMKHHMNLEGKHTESKMEIAEKQSLWLPLLVIKNPPCQSLVMVPWKSDFCSSKENCLDCWIYHMLEKWSLVRHHQNNVLSNIHACIHESSWILL